MRHRSRAAGIIAVLLLLSAWAGPVYGAEFEGEAKDDQLEFNAREGHAAEQAWLAESTDPALRLVEYMRAVRCGASSGRPSTPDNGDCTQDIDPTQAVDCGADEPLRPLWRRERTTPASTWGPWRFVSDWSCPAAVLPVLTAEDFRRLPLAPASVTLQPAASTVLVNVPTITMAGAPQQLLTTELLGLSVEVQATAVSYSWDYGDGSPPLVTTSAGRPYPNHDVHHTYARPGTYAITLTTTWSGQFRVAGAGGAWQAVDGTATTVSTVAPITAMEARSTLVAEPCTPSTC